MENTKRDREYQYIWGLYEFQTEKPGGGAGRSRAGSQCPAKGARRGQDQADPRAHRVQIRCHHRCVHVLCFLYFNHIDMEITRLFQVH